MAEEEFEIDSQTRCFLERLREAPARDAGATQHGRAAFLAQARSIKQAVSTPPHSRLNEWIDTLKTFFKRKELAPMLNTFMATLVILTLALGGTGATVFAAQDSLPDQALYPLKMISEDVSLSLTSQAQDRLRLLLQFSERRVQEMVALGLEGEGVPVPLANRHAQHVETALRLAAGLDDGALAQALVRVRAALQHQERVLAQLAERPGAQNDPAIEQVRLRLREQLRLVEMGQEGPDGFRDQIRERLRTRDQERLGTQGPDQPHPSRTPDPTGASYGPGPFYGSTRTPFGPQTSQPAPGAYGPGPGAGQPSATPMLAGTPQGPQYQGPTPRPSDANGPVYGGPTEPAGQGGGAGAGGGTQPTEPPGSGGGGQPTDPPGSGGGGQPQSPPPPGPGGPGTGNGGGGSGGGQP